MTDRQSGHHGRFLRAPGLRLDGVDAEILSLGPGETRSIGRADRAFFVHCIAGNATIARRDHGAVTLAAGDSAGIEKGGPLAISPVGADATLLASSVPRRHAYIADLPDDTVIIRAGDIPVAAMMARMTDAICCELEQGSGDPEVIRRLCEVIMLQLIRHVQTGLARMGQPPEAIRHDQHILRAWSAYFAEPAAAWTVEKLASAAGLSRSAFHDRFKGIFGAPPLETLTRLRLEHARELLAGSQATLPDIAIAIGYHSESALIRAFKREFGVSPGQWRKDAARDAAPR